MSVIIPCYNYGNYLKDAIQSVKNQTIDCEIIVVDDCSTDNTKEVAKGENVKLISNEINLHVSRSRNKGIEQATGTHVVCLDADDTLDPTYVETCLSSFKNNQQAIAYTPVKVCKDDLSLTQTVWFKTQATYETQKVSNSVPTMCMFSKRWWEYVDGYDPLLPGTEDANLWLKMLVSHGTAQRVTEKPLTNYRTHSGSLSQTSRPNWNIYSRKTVTYEFDNPQLTFIIDFREERVSFSPAGTSQI